MFSIVKFTDEVRSMVVVTLARRPVDCAFAAPGETSMATQAVISIPPARMQTRRQSHRPQRACAIIVMVVIELFRCPRQHGEVRAAPATRRAMRDAVARALTRAAASRPSLAGRLLVKFERSQSAG